MRRAICSGSISACEVNPAEPGPALEADYFDGLSARSHPVRARVVGSTLAIEGEAIDLHVPLREVRWPERTRHGARIAHFQHGGALQAGDVAQWDGWLHASGIGESVVVKAQQSWRWVAASVLALVLGIGALFAWGVPWLARGIVALLPATLDERIGASTLESIDGHLLRPSGLAPERQARIRAAFESALGALPPSTVPQHRVLFRKSRIGPNAFALPGGTIVLTDELVELMDDDETVLTGVLAHELGHVDLRHGMRLVVQVGAMGALASLVLGDFSGLLAAAPVLLGQAAYSRDAEREADREAVRVLRAAGISPQVMVTLFERLAQRRENKREATGDARRDAADAGSKGEPKAGEPRADPAPGWLGVAIASHPADSARIDYFRAAAAAR